ncbi:uncharacterized protein KZ484_012000 [Pholidichthys leucotaenia]
MTTETDATKDKLRVCLTKLSSQENDPIKNKIQEGDELKEDAAMKDFLKISPTETKRAVSPLALLKEDLSRLKEEVLNVFKDKDINPKTGQPVEKLINPLTLLKEDFKYFKDDLSSILRISKERDEKGATFSRTSNLNALQLDRNNESLKTQFKRDQTFFKMTQKSEEVRQSASEKSEGQTDHGLVGNSGKSVDTESHHSMKDVVDRETNIHMSEETEQSFKARICADPLRYESGEWRTDPSVVQEEEEEGEDSKPTQMLHWEAQPSGFTLFSLGNMNNGPGEKQGEDLWTLKNFACYLTLDPNTANSEIRLTDCNRKATRVWSDLQTSEYTERFEYCPQVLCREGLLDSVYWEVEWNGGADIGVTYNSIFSDNNQTSCLLGHNKQSWSLECFEGSYTPCYNKKRFKSSSPEPFSHRVGVYLNWPEGSLSFYCVSRDAMVHLHTFTATFTEPLYPGFWVWTYDGSVSLCQVELDWERQLQ